MFTAERSAPESSSDNPIFQRHLFAYEQAIPFIKGHVLEVGCGTGYGMKVLAPFAETYTAIDKFDAPTELPPNATFQQCNLPPLPFSDACFETVVSFQVIEHIEDDEAYIAEIARVLKPNGVALLTTPNIKMSLTRNPWHVREYTAAQLSALTHRHFASVTMKGIWGKEKAMAYYEENKKSVAKFKRLDIFDLENKLPRRLLQFPYDVLNRLNRLRLKDANEVLVHDLSTEDFYLDNTNQDTDICLDLFAVCLAH